MGLGERQRANRPADRRDMNEKEEEGKKKPNC